MRHLRVNVIYFTWCTTLFSTVVQLRNRRKNVIVYIQSMTLFFVIVYIQTMTLFLSLTAVNDTFWEFVHKFYNTVVQLWNRRKIVIDWSMTVLACITVGESQKIVIDWSMTVSNKALKMCH